MADIVSVEVEGMMSSVLIVQNTGNEGPGTIEDYLTVGRIPYRIVDLSQGEKVTKPADFDHLIIMGGPMSVKDRDVYPYLEDEKALIEHFLSGDKRILGICLGAQLLASVLGAEVSAGPEEETGWHDIELTSEGMVDPCMKNLLLSPEATNLSRKIKVFQWHGETFTMPDAAVRLAGSVLYPNQAFRYGDHAYAFQFHVEVTREMIYDWFSSNTRLFPQLQNETEENYALYRERALKFYEGFFRN